MARRPRSHGRTAFAVPLVTTSQRNRGNQQEFLKTAIQAGVYPKLQALQQIGEESNERLVYFMRRTREIANDPGADTPTKAKAESSLKYVANYLAQSPLSLRLALAPFAQSLSDQLPNLQGFEKAYVRLFVGNYDGLFAFSKERPVQKHLESFVAEVAEDDMTAALCNPCRCRQGYPGGIDELVRPIYSAPRTEYRTRQWEIRGLLAKPSHHEKYRSLICLGLH